MRVKTIIVKKELGSATIECFNGRVHVEHNRHGWHTTFSSQKHFLKKQFYLFLDALIRDLDEYCNAEFDKIKKLIVDLEGK